MLRSPRTLNGKRREQQLRGARAFARLSPEQRYHYNMKYGHLGDARREDRESGRALWHGLDEQARRALDEGFGGSIADLFARVMDSALQKDDQDLEMQALFEALLERA